MMLMRLFSVSCAIVSLVASVALHPVAARAVNVSPSAMTISAMPDDSTHVDLSVHEWEHRLLLVFAPSLDGESWAKQKEKWSGYGEGFEDRDLRIYVVAGEETGRFYAAPDGPAQPITTESARALRDRFDVAPEDYAVVLVGKDGTEKRRDPAPVHANAIFETIDAMPMRRAEMRGDG